MKGILPHHERNKPSNEFEFKSLILRLLANFLANRIFIIFEPFQRTDIGMQPLGSIIPEKLDPYTIFKPVDSRKISQNHETNS
jgi:hypothetical protein